VSSKTERTGRWKPGQSGNPGGRPPRRGEPSPAKLREAISRHAPAIVERLVEQAKGGDIATCRLLLERALPAIKPVEMPMPIAIGGDSLTESCRAVLTAVQGGVLAVGQGAHLLASIGVLAKIAETDELAARVAALEEAYGGKP
jgi:hypothetical protein